MILKEQKLTKENIDRLERKVLFYATEEGEKEIFNLMYDAKLFDVCTVEDLPLRNYAIAKLTELGFNQEDKIRKMIHTMLSWPVVLDRKAKETSDGND